MNLDELKKKAKAAINRTLVPYPDGSHKASSQTKDYVLAASPGVILKLIERLEDAENELKGYASLMGIFHGPHDVYEDMGQSAIDYFKKWGTHDTI